MAKPATNNLNTGISLESLRKYLRYDSETGKLFWRENRGVRGLAGSEAFNRFNANGYCVGKIFGKNLLAHRVIWFLVHEEWPDQIDHINGDRSDNRLVNLRSVTNAENARNKKVRRTSCSGVQGINYNKSKKKWEARITWNGKTEYLGAYPHLADAAESRKLAEKRYAFHENHGRL